MLYSKETRALVMQRYGSEHAQTFAVFVMNMVEHECVVLMCTVPGRGKGRTRRIQGERHKRDGIYTYNRQAIGSEGQERERRFVVIIEPSS